MRQQIARSFHQHFDAASLCILICPPTNKMDFRIYFPQLFHYGKQWACIKVIFAACRYIITVDRGVIVRSGAVGVGLITGDSRPRSDEERQNLFNLLSIRFKNKSSMVEPSASAWCNACCRPAGVRNLANSRPSSISAVLINSFNLSAWRWEMFSPVFWPLGSAVWGLSCMTDSIFGKPKSSRNLKVRYSALPVRPQTSEVLFRGFALPATGRHILFDLTSQPESVSQQRFALDNVCFPTDS